MTKPRTTRDEETRDEDIRNKVLSDPFYFENFNPLDVPEGVQREGYDLHYARLNIRGAQDYRVEDLIRLGWTYVPASRAKNRYIDPLNQNPISKEYILRKDLILMERPSYYKKAELQYYNKRVSDRTKNLPGMASESSRTRSINSF